MLKNSDVIRYQQEVKEFSPHFDTLRETSPEKAAADTLRNEIRESKEELEYVGKVYYISNNGDDNNDGLSPETAWKTLFKYDSLREELFEKAGGATLLLERGGIYRGYLLVCNNSRYGAYGEGAKPEIWCSKQNFADAALWNDCGNDIWSIELCGFDGNLMWDVGLITLDDKFGFKMISSVEDVEFDLEYYHNLDEGKLYIKSTEGNPGARFKNIEMSARHHGICSYGMKNYQIDNIGIKYAGFHGIANYNAEDVKITNCEFCYIGGSIYEGCRLGNAVEFWANCKNIVVEHCYAHQCYDTGLTHQAQDGIQTNVRFANNLIEDCIYGIEFFVRSEESFMENIVYENNIIRSMGYGFGMQRINPGAEGAIVGWWYPMHQNKAKNFVIKNNIFSCSTWQLVYLDHPNKEESDIRFIGNTYYQTKDIHTSAVKWTGGEILPADDQESLEKSIRKIDEDPKEIRFIK